MSVATGGRMSGMTGVYLGSSGRCGGEWRGGLLFSILEV